MPQDGLSHEKASRAKASGSFFKLFNQTARTTQATSKQANQASKDQTVQLCPKQEQQFMSYLKNPKPIMGNGIVPKWQTKMNKLRISHNNIHSNLNKKIELANYLSNLNIDITSINDIWLKPNKKINIPNYNIIRHDRLNRNGASLYASYQPHFLKKQTSVAGLSLTFSKIQILSCSMMTSPRFSPRNSFHSAIIDLALLSPASVEDFIDFKIEYKLSSDRLPFTIDLKWDNNIPNIRIIDSIKWSVLEDNL